MGRKLRDRSLGDLCEAQGIIPSTGTDGQHTLQGRGMETPFRTQMCQMCLLVFQKQSFFFSFSFNRISGSPGWP